MRQTWIALIPAYEPDEHMVRLVRELDTAGFDIVVVNDGSSRKSAEYFEEIENTARVIGYPVNHGKGYALRTGFWYIHEHYHGRYTVVTLDADGQHTCEDAVRVCNTASHHAGTLVLGSRAFAGKVPLRSRLGNKITELVFRLMTGMHIRDTQTGLRACDNELLERLLDVQGSRYEYEMNVLLRCSREQIPVIEVPIRTLYLDGNKSSHFNTVRDSMRIYKQILKFSGSSLICFGIDYLIYMILSLVTAGAANSIMIANVGARIVSSSINYTLNRRYVFHSNSSALVSAAQYFMLATGILAGNTFVLHALVENAGMNRFLAKILTEMIFFVISWTVQKMIIFRRKKPEELPENGCMKEYRKDDMIA